MCYISNEQAEGIDSAAASHRWKLLLTYKEAGKVPAVSVSNGFKLFRAGYLMCYRRSEAGEI